MIQEILAKVDFLELVSRKVFLTKIKDTSYKGLSPFTGEKTPSFFVNPKSKTWFDFSSGQGGGVLDYVMKTEALDKSEALAMLADLTGVELEVNDKLASLRQIMKCAYNFFLKHAAEAIPYMAERGFSEETLKRYGIAFAPKGGKRLIEYLEGEGFTPEAIIEAGLGYTNSNGYLMSRYQNRVVFPIKDAFGMIVSLSGRAIDPNPQAKYLHGISTKLFHKKDVVWNLSSVRNLIAQHNSVIVCEGQLDALSLCQAGLPGVAILGAAPSENQLRLLAGASTNIYFVFDSDHAGEQALLNAFKLAEEIGIDSVLYTITLPEGEDPNSFLQNHPLEEFTALMTNARSDTSVIIRTLLKQYLEEAQGKKSRAEIAAGVIRALTPYIKNKLTYRSLDLIERTSQEFSLDQNELRKMLLRKNATSTRPNAVEVSKITFSPPIYERRLLYSVLDNPANLTKFQGSGLGLSDFESPLVSKVFSVLPSELSSADAFEFLKKSLTEDEYYTILEFYSKGLDETSIDTSLDVMRAVVNKRVSDMKNNFIGRPVPDNDFTRAKRKELREKIRNA